MTIVLYDVPSHYPGRSSSANSRKARYCLNYKGLAHVTEWIEMPDIASYYKKHNISTSFRHADGSPKYTVPFIYDPSTNTYLNDSEAIAQYLDDTYPGPKIFPHGTRALQALVEDAYRAYISDILILGFPKVLQNVNPPSKDYYDKLLGPPSADNVEPTAEVLWAGYREGVEKVNEWYAKSGGPFLMGNIISWGDFVIAAHVNWLKIVWGEDSAEWKEVASWHGGRWASLLEAVQPYAETH